MSFIKSLRKLNVVKFSYEVSHLHRDRYHTFCQISDRQVDQKVVQFLTLKVLPREDCDGEIVTEDGYDSNDSKKQSTKPWFHLLRLSLTSSSFLCCVVCGDKEL